MSKEISVRPKETGRAFFTNNRLISANCDLSSHFYSTPLLFSKLMPKCHSDRGTELPRVISLSLVP